MSKTQVIIVAGGLGKRLKTKIPKALALLKGKPLVSYSLKVFESHKHIHSIIVVGAKAYLPQFERMAGSFKKVRAVVTGGAERADSVKCGLNALDADTDIVLVHDAARPCVDAGMIDRLLGSLKNHKAAIVAVPVKATIKKVNAKTMQVEETLRRDLLWDVQTPQGFHKDILVKAHAQKLKVEATDDAMMVEALAVKVKVVMGDYKNIKVTTPEDMAIAKVFL